MTERKKKFKQKISLKKIRNHHLVQQFDSLIFFLTLTFRIISISLFFYIHFFNN